MKNKIVRAGWFTLACAFYLVSWQPTNAFSQDAIAGRLKAKTCAICHGSIGIAVNANSPNLAGENAIYIKTQLHAFRSGKRKHHQMSIIASGLSDDDIANLARWYSLIKVVATPPDLD